METQNNNPNNLGALGFWVTAIVGVVSVVVPLIVKWTQKEPADVWSGWEWSMKTQYVQEGIIVAKEAIRQGAATTIEETMQVLIAQVELDESWDYWKERNERYIPMMAQAQSEIDAEMANNGSLASIISTKALLWVLGFSVLGFGFYWFKFRKKPENQTAIENKPLT